MACCVRKIEERDLVASATILFDAFEELNRSANPAALEIDFGSLNVALGAVGARLKDPSSEGVVAVKDGDSNVVGVGFITFGGAVNSLSLIAVSPKMENKGIGKAITLSLLEKSKKSAASSVRLVQGAPNTKSFALYVKLGFRPVEYWNNFFGPVTKQQALAAAEAVGVTLSGYVVRRMELDDVNDCSMLFFKAVGYDRELQIREKVKEAQVILKNDTLVGYTTGFDRSGYTLASSEEAAIALLASADHLHVYIIGQLYPRLLRWAFEARLALIRHGSFMALGSYKRPAQGMVWSVSGNI